MGLSKEYEAREPSRAELDALPGATVVEFGTPWCGWCRGAQADIAKAFEGRDEVRHMKFEDGSGRRLGRSFKVKLWPTLVFMKDGEVVETLVRPRDAQSIQQAMEKIA